VIPVPAAERSLGRRVSRHPVLHGIERGTPFGVGLLYRVVRHGEQDTSRERSRRTSTFMWRQFSESAASPVGKGHSWSGGARRAKPSG